jgi:hypothetical protein
MRLWARFEDPGHRTGLWSVAEFGMLIEVGEVGEQREIRVAPDRLLQTLACHACCRCLDNESVLQVVGLDKEGMQRILSCVNRRCADGLPMRSKKNLKLTLAFNPPTFPVTLLIAWGEGDANRIASRTQGLVDHPGRVDVRRAAFGARRPLPARQIRSRGSRLTTTLADS